MIILALTLLSAQAAPPTPGTTAADEKKVCRTVGSATGSILNRPRECHTKAEWAEIALAKAKLNERFSDTRARQLGMPKAGF